MPTADRRIKKANQAEEHFFETLGPRAQRPRIKDNESNKTSLNPFSSRLISNDDSNQVLDLLMGGGWYFNLPIVASNSIIEI